MQKEDYHWLPSEYVWRAKTMGQEMENEAEVVSSFVPGEYELFHTGSIIKLYLNFFLD